jgi:hypothetical protein
LLLNPATAETTVGLAPSTVTGYLRAAAPVTDEIRVNGIYGSGHRGAWQFVAHITWRDGISIKGGTVNLPQLAGQPALTSEAGEARLTFEHGIGWSLDRLDGALEHIGGVSDGVAVVELELPQSGIASLVSCHASQPGPAVCRQQGDSAAGPREFRGTLTDEPFRDALSVGVNTTENAP